MPAHRAYVCRSKVQKLSNEQEQKNQDVCAILLAFNSPNICAAAKEHDVSYHTLRWRFLGLTQPYNKAHAAQQILSPESESVLVDWIKHLSAIGHPLSKQTIQIKVAVLCGSKPGSKWIRGFLVCHPDITLGKPSALDLQHCQSFNHTVVKHHFELLKKVIEEKEIPWENIYNMDEKGCQHGGGQKTSPEKYFVPHGRYPKYKAHSSNLELVTIIECVCADGTNLLPGFMFSGNEFFHVLRHFAQFTFSLAMSPTGWTDHDIFEHWFTTVFVPEAEKCHVDPNKPIMLMLNGHNSHERRELKSKHCNGLWSHCIIIIAFPLKTMHKLQPLDVGVFSSVQCQWSKHYDEHLAHGVCIDCFNFIPKYLTTCHAITPSLVQKAFSKPGIYPLNLTIFH
ncbi:hypothetical protein PAXRUDRAFT_153759 [Paxillus rubicundulus Ve08.2h10]|uniref:HTH CENPB-type domain-containing protein n=1 Tax=Paxillus rubicundulus Ve08.2h10 TaxID=930991 RepID=A0A0D0DRR1_9AGAM|nr:hypothetical protein PAXRUDRAFT_153759 [Paxillus rubicundulus Ve08.2h10]